MPDGALLIQLGGPGMLIGMGGGAASSMATGANTADLDFDSVQRGNAEIQRRAQEVIDRCWQLGAANPILSIHDVGAGGLSNAFPELVHGGGAGARSTCARFLPRNRACRRARSGATKRRSATCSRSAPPISSASAALCERERCPFAVVGRATRDDRLVVADPQFGNRAGRHGPRRAARQAAEDDARRRARAAQTARRSISRSITIKEAAYRVLQVPAVADKTFLVTIGDRTVGGLCSRDPMVGPWQVPVADVAVTLMDFDGYAGEAMAIGERTPLALIDAPASGRMAVGEAITNIAAAGIAQLSDIKLSANWMAPAGHPGEDAALYDTVRAVAMELCPALGISIPVGKDSMSMRTTWREGGVDKAVTAPLSLIVSAFAPVPDARRTLTPQLALDAGATTLLWIDLGGGPAAPRRLGAGAGLRATRRRCAGSRRSGAARSVLRDDPGAASRRHAARVSRHRRRRAVRDAGRDGVRVALRPDDRRSMPSACDPLAALFAEELGAVVQVRARRREPSCGEGSPSADSWRIAVGVPTADARIRIVMPDKHAARRIAHRPPSRVVGDDACNAAAARQPARRRPGIRPHSRRAAIPGLSPLLTFDPSDDVAAPFIARGARPAIAILREQGVNGQVEMAAAFDRAGFAAYDVHMSDIIAGAGALSDFSGLRRLRRVFLRRRAGRRRRLGQVDPVQCAGARRVRRVLRARRHLRARRVQRLPDDEQPARADSGRRPLAAFRPQPLGAVRGALRAARSACARRRSSSAGMEGSRIPVATAHGEGYAEFRDAAQLACGAAVGRAALRRQRADARPSAIRTMRTARRRASPGSRPPMAASRS